VCISLGNDEKKLGTSSSEERGGVLLMWDKYQSDVHVQAVDRARTKAGGNEGGQRRGQGGRTPLINEIGC
jgi:hypothetical protein